MAELLVALLDLWCDVVFASLVSAERAAPRGLVERTPVTAPFAYLSDERARTLLIRGREVNGDACTEDPPPSP